MQNFRRTGLAMAFGALALLPSPGSAHASPRATVAQGKLLGLTDGGVSAFLGIPYAAPPVGAGRWAPPREAIGWRGVTRKATKFGPSCPQPMIPGGMAMWTSEYSTPEDPGLSENCLFANIWTPANLSKNRRSSAGLPVLVFIHGGAYLVGSGSVPIYNGAKLAKKGVVVVTINYRLGVLGFLAHPELSKEQGGSSGNYGIQDQIEALRWVRRNIGAFGGDSSKVTIAGQSAGGGSVLTLMSSPLAKGLFRGAIIESMPLNFVFSALETAEQQGAAIVKSWGTKTIAEARMLPVDRLIVGSGNAGPRLGVIGDGRVLPNSASSPEIVNDVPVIIGYTLNDLFIPARKPTADEWRSDAQIRYGKRAGEFLRFYPGDSDVQASLSAAREATDREELAPLLNWIGTRGATSPVYAYLFSHVEPGPESARFGAFHSSDLPYLFDTLDRSPGRRFTAIDKLVANAYSGAFVNFVKTLNPNNKASFGWPALSASGRGIMEFGDSIKPSRIYPLGSDDVIDAGVPPPAPPSPVIHSKAAAQ